MLSLLGLDPATYSASGLHDADRTFRETNCYVDIWIELLHAHGIPAESALGFAATIDFEGDQWTFFKPPPEDLLALHGMDVHEMQLYRPTTDHVTEQLRAGRTMILEADSFHMPDTAATAYRKAHVKSSIAIEAIDVAGERLRYFHGAGYHELTGEDFRGVFRLGRTFSYDVLPPYAEIVRFDAGPRLSGEALQDAARRALQGSLAKRPKHNPWHCFGERLSRDLPTLLAGTEQGYHAYAFATVRQCGAAFELAGSFVTWLAPEDESTLGALSRQVAGAKALLFKLARRRAFDVTPLMSSLANDWDAMITGLERMAGS